MFYQCYVYMYLAILVSNTISISDDIRVILTVTVLVRLSLVDQELD